MSLAKRIIELLDDFDNWRCQGNYYSHDWTHIPTGLSIRFGGKCAGDGVHWFDIVHVMGVDLDGAGLDFGLFDSWRLLRAFSRMRRRKEINRVESGLGPIRTLPHRILMLLNNPLDWEHVDGTGWVHGTTGYTMHYDNYKEVVNITAPQEHTIEGRAAQRIRQAFDAIDKHRIEAKLEEMLKRAEPK